MQRDIIIASRGSVDILFLLETSVQTPSRWDPELVIHDIKHVEQVLLSNWQPGTCIFQALLSKVDRCICAAVSVWSQSLHSLHSTKGR